MDINCDLGEGISDISFSKDQALMGYATSINLACGFHAGNYEMMGKIIDFALEKNIKIGAHPGYDDSENFGRLPQNLSRNTLEALLTYQIGALKTMVEAKGGKLHHVKLHGALYNQSAKDKTMAEVVSDVILSIDKNLIVYGPYGSVFNEVLKNKNIKVFNECFADRKYIGYELAPRKDDGLYHEVKDVIKHCKHMLLDKQLVDRNKEVYPIDCDTLCVHGDHANSLEILKAVKAFVVSHED